MVSPLNQAQKTQQELEEAKKETQQSKDKIQEVQNQLTQKQNQLTQVQTQLSQIQTQLQQNQNQLTQTRIKKKKLDQTDTLRGAGSWPVPLERVGWERCPRELGFGGLQRAGIWSWKRRWKGPWSRRLDMGSWGRPRGHGDLDLTDTLRRARPEDRAPESGHLELEAAMQRSLGHGKLDQTDTLRGGQAPGLSDGNDLIK
ncbi:hypothetical protein EYF80_029409 [Liparis tanakae]|uniref:Uncharacterized protein n=1 Tax=Liparis tanakae TaxID=230148 RepID=A0A4Z2H4N5_9TELE|nr:hypothetical protein EYF80_029409 [Liparis tanakae]